MAGLMEGQSPAHYTLNGTKLQQLPADFYSSRSYADFLMDSIREHHGDGKPFLAYLAFTAPHDPLHVPEPRLSQYRRHYNDGYEALKARRAAAAQELGLIPKTATVPGVHPMVKKWDTLSQPEQALQARAMEVYAGMIANVDYHVGRVVTFLKDIGAYDNTVIIFTSDNGPNPWDSDAYPTVRGSQWFAQFDNRVENVGHRHSNYAYGIGWASAAAGPLTRFKMTVGEGGIRTPLLVAGPGVKANIQVGTFAYVTDIMPTVLDMAGLEQDGTFQGRKVETMRGRPLTKVLSGKEKRVYSVHDFIGGEMGNGKWMRQGNFKAVSVAPPYGSGEWHLYNIAVDPGEMHNLANEQPETLLRLQTAWEHYAKDVGVVLRK